MPASVASATLNSRGLPSHRYYNVRFKYTWRFSMSKQMRQLCAIEWQWLRFKGFSHRTNDIEAAYGSKRCPELLSSDLLPIIQMLVGRVPCLSDCQEYYFLVSLMRGGLATGIQAFKTAIRLWENIECFRIVIMRQWRPTFQAWPAATSTMMHLPLFYQVADYPGAKE